MNLRILIAAFALLLAACGSDIDDKPDGGSDDGGSDSQEMSGELTVLRNGNYTSLDEAGEIEIISGFQGGWHVEPHLRVSNVESNALNGTARFWVDQSGTMIAESGQQQFEPIFFQVEGDDFVFYSQPVIFVGSNTADSLAGTQATIRVDFQLDDGRSLDLSTDVTLINEVEEFDF